MGEAKISGTRVTMKIIILSLLITLVVSQSTRQEPPPGQRCSGRNYNGRRCCTPEQPCGLGEGDCDGPLDGGTHDGHQGCKGDLVCGSNNCRKFGAYFHEKDDCCDRPENLPVREEPVIVPGTPLERDGASGIAGTTIFLRTRRESASILIAIGDFQKSSVLRILTTKYPQFLFCKY